MKKILSYVLVLLISIISFVDCVNAKSAPGAVSVNAGISSGDLNYIKSVSFKMKTVNGELYAYCLNRYKNTYSIENYFQYKKMDEGFKYLIKNGYPNKSITGDSKKDYYITQMAIWAYQDSTSQYDSYDGHTSNLEKDFFVVNNNTTNDPYQLIRKIIALMEGAINARGRSSSTNSCQSHKLGVSSSSINLEKSGKYYVSSPISVDTDASYTVSFPGVIKDALIVNQDGKSVEEFASTDKFIIKIPVGYSFKETEVIIKNVDSENCTSSFDVYEYRSKVSDHQNILIASMYNDSVSSSTSARKVKVLINSNIKDDSSTSDSKDNDKNNDNNTIDSSTSNDVCNNGEDCSSSSSDSNTDTDNDLGFDVSYDDNSSDTFVPNTSFNASILPIISGLFIIMFGLGFVYLNVKKKKAKN